VTLHSSFLAKFCSAKLSPLHGKELFLPADALPAFVVSAQNRNGRQDSESYNQRAHALLQAQLKAYCPTMIEELIGQSPDEQWKELCWLVAGISLEQALTLGRRYQQLAIFSFTMEKGEIIRKVLEC
jgi:hypothetical protein